MPSRDAVRNMVAISAVLVLLFAIIVSAFLPKIDQKRITPADSDRFVPPPVTSAK